MNLHFNRFSNPGSFFIGGSKSESAGIDQRIIIDFHADDIARDAGLIVHDRNPPARKTVKNPAFAHIGLADDGYDTRISHRSEEHTSELQSRGHLVCRLL